MLPPEARREDFRTHEEIELPPMKAGTSAVQQKHLCMVVLLRTFFFSCLFLPTAPPRETERRVPISEFSSVAQLAFRGFTHLNRIQSIMFDTVQKYSYDILCHVLYFNHRRITSVCDRHTRPMRIYWHVRRRAQVRRMLRL